MRKRVEPAVALHKLISCTFLTLHEAYHGGVPLPAAVIQMALAVQHYHMCSKAIGPTAVAFEPKYLMNHQSHVLAQSSKQGT